MRAARTQAALLAAAAWLAACTTPPAAPPVPPAAPVVQAPPLPYSEAVAARFPDPAVSYDTPGLQPMHDAFTSNAELSSALHRLAATSSPRMTIALLPLGASQRGVPLEALVFTREPDGSPAALARSGRPTVLLVGQQHGDEPAGSEALLVIAQHIGDGPLASLLDRINVIVLPRANPDGADAKTRVSANGIDINRDHLLLRTPEAQAQAKLVREYRPQVVVDAHEYTANGRFAQKFGGVPRFDAMAQYATTANLPPELTRLSEEAFRRPMLKSLADEGLTVEWYHTTSTDLADKKVSMGGVQPDTARNVQGLKNAISLLIETRGIGIGRLHLKRRVHTQVVAASSVLRSAARQADALLAARRSADAEVAAQACRGEAIVEAGATSEQRDLVVLDPVSGADKSLPLVWDSSLTLRVLKSRPRPCGYWLGADAEDAVRTLRELGVNVQRLGAAQTLSAERWRETARSEGARQDVRGTIADAGGAVIRVQVALAPQPLAAPPSSYYVSLEQPLANLAIAALEPDTQNSFFANRLLRSLDDAARVTTKP
ncbi:MAG TPA: M14 family metallopeptidase [Burkholderiaceae bacterium]|jgi:hypothetical protein|nr:M14 family metallopeptidase [Burkholderiaceae bacterium]